MPSEFLISSLSLSEENKLFKSDQKWLAKVVGWLGVSKILCLAICDLKILTPKNKEKKLK